jgi:hypothetical protein
MHTARSGAGSLQRQMVIGFDIGVVPSSNQADFLRLFSEFSLA